MKKRHVALIIYFGFLLLPIYWLLAMSLKTNVEITSSSDAMAAAADLRQLLDDLDGSRVVLGLH